MIITTTDNYTTLPDKYIITSEFTIKLIGLFLFVFILIFRMVSYFTGLDCIVVIYRRCVSQRQGSSPYWASSHTQNVRHSEKPSFAGRCEKVPTTICSHQPPIKHHPPADGTDRRAGAGSATCLLAPSSHLLISKYHNCDDTNIEMYCIFRDHSLTGNIYIIWYLD